MVPVSLLDLSHESRVKLTSDKIMKSWKLTTVDGWQIVSLSTAEHQPSRSMHASYSKISLLHTSIASQNIEFVSNRTKKRNQSFSLLSISLQVIIIITTPNTPTSFIDCQPHDWRDHYCCHKCNNFKSKNIEVEQLKSSWSEKEAKKRDEELMNPQLSVHFYICYFYFRFLFSFFFLQLLFDST